MRYFLYTCSIDKPFIYNMNVNICRGWGSFTLEFSCVCEDVGLSKLISSSTNNVRNVCRGLQWNDTTVIWTWTLVKFIKPYDTNIANGCLDNKNKNCCFELPHLYCGHKCALNLLKVCCKDTCIPWLLSTANAIVALLRMVVFLCSFKSLHVC